MRMGQNFGCSGFEGKFLVPGHIFGKTGGRLGSAGRGGKVDIRNGSSKPNQMVFAKHAGVLSEDNTHSLMVD